MKPEKINNIVSDPLEPVVEETPVPVADPVAEVTEAVEAIKDLAEKEEKKNNAKYFVTDTPKLNVRETPNGKIIKVIESGEEVVLSGKSEDKDWYKIKSPIQGYVMKKYIKKV